MQRSTKLAISALALALTLSACGGGDDNNDSAPANSSSAASSTASSTSSTASSASSTASSASSTASSTSSTASSASSTASSTSSTASSTSSTASSSSSSASASAVVLQANFQTVPVGLADGVEATWSSPVALPLVTNTATYTAQLIGKLKVVTTQAPPTSGSGIASNGVVQFGNKTTSPGKVQILQVQCPFKLTVNHAPSSTGDTTRKLRIDVAGSQAYYDGNGDFMTASVSPTCSGKVDVDIYGWFDSSVTASPNQGAGVRVFDIQIEQ